MTGIYGWTNGLGGVPYFRIFEPFRVAAAGGVNATHGPQLDDDILSTVDTVLVDKLWDPKASEGWQRLAKLGTHRLIIDVDDWVWGCDWKPMQDAWTPEAVDQLYANIRAAHVVTTPTVVLAEHLAKLNSNVWVVPNTVPAWILDRPTFPTTDPTLVYEGSPSHQRDWTHTSAGKHLGMFLRDHPDWGVNWYGSTSGLPAAFPGRIAEHGWLPNVDDHLATIGGTVMIGPLRNTPFNRAKSGLRAQVAQALGIIPVLPDMPGYRPFVADGVTGRLIAGGQTMRKVLADVAAEPEWRDLASKLGREAAAAWTTEAAIDAWLQAWNSR